MISTLYLMPTQQCNCRCDYCYLPDEEKCKTGDADFFNSVVERYISTSPGSGNGEIPQLRFIGGEPYLEFDAMRKLSVRFLDRFPDGIVVINTNGTLIDESDLTPILEFRDNIYHVVSLDGIEDVHNARRHPNNGGNAFMSAVSGIRLLGEMDFPVYVNMVLDHITAECIDEFMRYLKYSLGMNTLSVSLLHSMEIGLSVEEKFDLLRNAYITAGEYGMTLTGHHRLLLGDRIPELRCRAGEKTVLISSDRKLVACQRFVGRDDDAPVYDDDYDFTGTECSKSDCCYTDEVRRLADMLYDLYERRFPQYLCVNEVDKILFGTI